MNPETKRLLDDIRKYKGDDFVILCAVEEMAELSKELLKNTNRRKDNIGDIKEELSDVAVCMEHVKEIFNISDREISNIINEKIPRRWTHEIQKLKESAA